METYSQLQRRTKVESESQHRRTKIEHRVKIKEGNGHNREDQRPNQNHNKEDQRRNQEAQQRRSKTLTQSPLLQTSSEKVKFVYRDQGTEFAATYGCLLGGVGQFRTDSWLALTQHSTSSPGPLRRIGRYRATRLTE